jgi:hypothetical protein
MKSLNYKTDAVEIISRIKLLDENSQPIWGKMNASQMVRHLIMWEELAMKKRVYKQAFMGKIFGKIALKSIMKAEVMNQNMPTVAGFIPDPDGDLDTEKQTLIDLISTRPESATEDIVHPFFGKMSAEQAAILGYKHVDHHLRQFGVYIN